MYNSIPWGQNRGTHSPPPWGQNWGVTPPPLRILHTDLEANALVKDERSFMPQPQGGRI